MKPLIKKKSGGQYSWQDYLNWPENERWEIIDGVAYNMSPAPSIKHQTTAGNLFSLLNQKLAGKPCKPFIAPTDVVLSEHDVVQPDVLIVCDPAKITEQNIQGVPDLVVEVLSPATALKDLREKKALYERFAVKEYIILDPLELYVQQFFLGKDGTYGKGEVLGPEEVLRLKTIEGIEIMLWEVFEVERPLEEELSP
jgi:Uma2 family endonuclease